MTRAIRDRICEETKDLRNDELIRYFNEKGRSGAHTLPAYRKAPSTKV